MLSRYAAEGHRPSNDNDRQGKFGMSSFGMLYKYRAFSDSTVEMIVDDLLFFADPCKFNDPLDTRPSLNPDIDGDALNYIFKRLVEKRVNDERTAATNALGYNDASAQNRIKEYARQTADELANEIRYHASNPESDFGADPTKYLFALHIEDELLRRYDKGIVSLAERADCPLMWSHYGDQHKGLCIGYSGSETVACDLRKVKYGRVRLIAASKVAAMLDGDDQARQEVDNAVLARKALDWCYEREWRLIGPRGLCASPFELEEIIFGMRCTPAVKFAVAKMLSDRKRPVKMYEMGVNHDNFVLKKHEIDVAELCASRPRRALDVYDAFKAVVFVPPP